MDEPSERAVNAAQQWFGFNQPGALTKALAACFDNMLALGRLDGLEEAAKLIEAKQEWAGLGKLSGKRGVSDRIHGNLSGMAYADAIRALIVLLVDRAT